MIKKVQTEKDNNNNTHPAQHLFNLAPTIPNVLRVLKHSFNMKNTYHIIPGKQDLIILEQVERVRMSMAEELLTFFKNSRMDPRSGPDEGWRTVGIDELLLVHLMADCEFEYYFGDLCTVVGRDN